VVCFPRLPDELSDWRETTFGKWSAYYSGVLSKHPLAILIINGQSLLLPCQTISVGAPTSCHRRRSARRSREVRITST
jgi:hypothetical protein